MKNKKNAIVVVLIALIACGLTFYAMGIRQKQELAMYQNRITLFQKTGSFIPMKMQYRCGRETK